MSEKNSDKEKLEQQLMQIKKTTDATANVIKSALSNVDFSYLAEVRENYIKNVVPVLSSMQETFAQYREISSKIVESMAPYFEMTKRWSEITAPFAETLKSFSKVATKYKAIQKLGNSQLIWFDNLDDRLANDILSEVCTDTIITQHLEDTSYIEIDRIIAESRKSSFLKEKKGLYSHSIGAYRKKHYDLACIGFIGTIDYLMSKTSGDISTSSKKHIQIILEKMKTDEVLDSFEFSFFTTFLSFENVIQSLFAFSDFSTVEPSELNRHWIAHGRTQKEYSKLDCVKLINLIYALLLIGSVQVNELDK